MKIEIYSPTIRRKEMDAVLTAMVEEKIGPGERNKLLIQTAKEQLHFDYALALRSPAVALHLALKALNVRSGQAVVLSALSPRYYLQVLRDLQLIPLFCDVTYDFPCMNRDLIETTIAKKSSIGAEQTDINDGACADNLDICAIVLHHTLGFVPDAAAISELGIPVIEDISQSYGSWFKFDSKNEKTETSENKDKEKDNNSSNKVEQDIKINGVFCILGLEEKDMLTSGGGALLFAMNRKDASALRNFAGIANEYCLPDINAALAVVQFKEVQRNIERRQDITKVYNQACLSLAARTKHKRFIPVNDNEYCNYSFSLVLETGLKDVVAYAKKKEIEIVNAFENSIAGINLLESKSALNTLESTGESSLLDNCPVSNSLVLRTVLFPMYPRLRSQDVERVSRLIMTLP